MFRKGKTSARFALSIVLSSWQFEIPTFPISFLFQEISSNIFYFHHVLFFLLSYGLLEDSEFDLYLLIVYSEWTEYTCSPPIQNSVLIILFFQFFKNVVLLPSCLSLLSLGCFPCVASRPFHLPKMDYSVIWGIFFLKPVGVHSVFFNLQVLCFVKF